MVINCPRIICGNDLVAHGIAHHLVSKQPGKARESPWQQTFYRNYCVEFCRAELFGHCQGGVMGHLSWLEDRRDSGVAIAIDKFKGKLTVGSNTINNIVKRSLQNKFGNNLCHVMYMQWAADHFCWICGCKSNRFILHFSPTLLADPTDSSFILRQLSLLLSLAWTLYTWSKASPWRRLISAEDKVMYDSDVWLPTTSTGTMWERHLSSGELYGVFLRISGGKCVWV